MTKDEDTGLEDLEAEFADAQEADVVETAPKPKPAAKKKPAAVKAKTTRIVLEDSDEIPPTGLYVGHNGRGYLIRTGEPVDVPDHILEILDHAVMAQPQFDPQTRRVVGYRRRMRYPYRRV